MTKRKTQPPEKWESIGKNNRFVRLFIEQLESPAAKKLNGRQRALYLYMKIEYRGNETKNNPNGKKEQFCFNWQLAHSKYELYTNQKTFYNDIKVLIEYGFIECVENNKNLRQKNVYAFSDKWKDIH